MSLESKIEALTAAVLALSTKLDAITVAAPVVAAPSHTLVTPAMAAPVPQAPAFTTAPAAPAMPAVPAPVAAVTMPAPPAFTVPAPVAAPVAAAPFTDANGLTAYVMDAYQKLGAEKGGKIGDAMVALGYQNITEVKPESYGALYAAVEALKVS